MPPLPNPRHETFAQLLTTGQTATIAYGNAGYRENTGARASHLASRPFIQARVQEIQKANLAASSVTVRRVLSELSRLAFADITGAFAQDDAGNLVIRRLDDIPPDLRAAISEIRRGKDGISVKFHSKPEALAMLGKHLSMFRDSIDISVNISLHDLVLGSYRIERGELPAPAPLELDAIDCPDNAQFADSSDAPPLTTQAK